MDEINLDILRDGETMSHFPPEMEIFNLRMCHSGDEDVSVPGGIAAIGAEEERLIPATGRDAPSGDDILCTSYAATSRRHDQVSRRRDENIPSPSAVLPLLWHA